MIIGKHYSNLVIYNNKTMSEQEEFIEKFYQSTHIS